MFLCVLLFLAPATSRAQPVAASGSAPDDTSNELVAIPRNASGWNRAYRNWSDLPFRLFVNQSISYNDNVTGVANGRPIGFGIVSKGDWLSSTTFGGSTKMNLGQQQLFFDGNLGTTKYKSNSLLDKRNHSVTGGLNWVFTSRCAGRLSASSSAVETTFEDMIGTGTNTASVFALNQTARCRVGSNTSLIFDTGWSSSENSNGASAGNNSTAKFVRSGLEYTPSSLTTIGANATYTETSYQNRAAAAAVGVIGLANRINRTNLQVTLQRQLTQKLSFNGSVGLSAVTTNTAPGTGTGSTYSASLRWAATPKLSLSVSSAHSVASPTTVLANSQTTDSQSISASYALSPKVSVQSGLSRSVTSGSSGGNIQGAPAFGSGLAFSFSSSVSYQATPFVSGTASFQNTMRSSSGVDTNVKVFMLGLAYRPY